MKKYILLIFIGILILTLFKNRAYFSKQTTAPMFSSILITGEQFNLSDLKGEYVLLDFWGSWCAPCLKEIPKLLALHKKYPDKLNIVSIGLEKNFNSGLKASIVTKLNWEYQIIEERKIVLLSELARKYGVANIPAKFLIFPDGTYKKNITFQEIENYLNN